MFVKDLAEYLGCTVHLLTVLAKKRQLLRWAHVGVSPRWLEYVTPHGAQRLITFIRSLQGAEYLVGKDHHERKEKQRAGYRRYAERKRLKEHSV